MKKSDPLFYESAQLIWKNIANHTTLGSIIKLDKIEELKNSIFNVGESYFFTFDIVNGEFITISNEIEQILGFIPNEITVIDFLNQIHPDDQPYFLQFEAQLNDFYKRLPTHKIDGYKIQYDFRIADVNGNWKRILHQMIIIEFDDNNNLITSLGIHSDISHIKLTGKPILSFIGLNGNPSYFNYGATEKMINAKPSFTKREIEILHLIMVGKTSAMISEELFVSIHTINAHRKNILRKAECDSVSKLLIKAIAENWI